MRLLACVGNKEASKRPLCGLPKPNSNLSREDQWIMRICVSFPICIEALRRCVLSFPILIVTLEIWRDSWTLLNEITSHLSV